MRRFTIATFIVLLGLLSPMQGMAAVPQSPATVTQVSRFQPHDTVVAFALDHTVHLDAAKTPPKGATAECKDGTYSFSKHRRGTCSHHGGVKRWLKKVPA